MKFDPYTCLLCNNKMIINEDSFISFFSCHKYDSHFGFYNVYYTQDREVVIYLNDVSASSDRIISSIDYNYSRFYFNKKRFILPDKFVFNNSPQQMGNYLTRRINLLGFE